MIKFSTGLYLKRRPQGIRRSSSGTLLTVSVPCDEEQVSGPTHIAGCVRREAIVTACEEGSVDCPCV